TTTSWPASRDRSPAVVITAIGAASATMNPNRAAGSPTSIGKYAAPALSTPNIATTAWAERSSNNPATHPGPTPDSANRCANRLAASSSSRYVHEQSPHTNATASGARCTCAANTTGTDPE